MTEDSEQLTKDSKENIKSNVSSDRVNRTTNKSSNGVKRDKNRDNQQMRIVVRHLPPTMTSDQLLESISPIPEHNDYYFCKSDPSLGAFGFTRAYINFIHTEDMFVFKDKFDGYVFVDTKGNEFPAIVEFAPFQRIPRRRMGSNGQPILAKKRDNKCGTIEQDSDYIEFLQELEKSKAETNMPSAEVYLEEIEARDKQMKANHGLLTVSTPLTEFLKHKKLEKNRLREERREERRRQQERIREEEQQRRQLKKAKAAKEVDRSEGKGKSEKSNKRDEEKSKTRDLDKKDRNESKSNENSKKYEKKTIFSNRNKTEKLKETNVSKDKNESTFVVKMVNKTQDLKAGNTSENKKSDTCANSKDNEDVVKEVDNKTIENRSERKESSSKGFKESSNKVDSKTRIKNKDRPTREIYKPGAVRRNSKEVNDESQKDNSGHNTSANKSEQTSGGYKQRVFTRSKH